MEFHNVSILADAYTPAINTLVTASLEIVDEWLHNLVISRHPPFLLGLGVEVADAGGAATIQLCIDTKCLIYRMFPPHSFSQTLIAFLVDPNVTLLGFGLQSKLHMIMLPTFRDHVRYLDLKLLENRTFVMEGPPSSYRLTIAMHALESVDVVWPMPDGRWDLPVLPYQHVRYACIRAYVALQMGRLIKGKAPEGFIFRTIEEEGPRGQEEGPMEHVHEVEIFDRTIVTTVTNRVAAVEKWITAVSTDGGCNQFIGFDAMVYDGHDDKSPPRIATVQLCVGRRCLVIHFEQMKSKYLPKLERFLMREGNTFVGVSARFKLKTMRKWWWTEIGGRMRGFNLEIFAANLLGRLDLVDADPQTLVKRLFFKDVGRPCPENGWFRIRLSDAHVEYACVNAAACYEIGKRLLANSTHI